MLLIFSFHFPSECMRFLSLPFNAPIDWCKTTTRRDRLLQFTSSVVAPSFVRNQLKYAEQYYKYCCCFCFVFLRNVRAICICKQRPHVGRDRYKGGNVSMQHPQVHKFAPAEGGLTHQRWVLARPANGGYPASGLCKVKACEIVQAQHKIR